ncbi:unnamed protein product [Colias eurytheme]|nr:unnamed protein product [Colias eurytheme]
MNSLNEPSYFMDNNGPENNLAEIISSKSYLPNENQLPKVSLIKKEGDEATYLLSKLSDEDLVKLLSEQPTKSEYDLSDIAKIAVGSNSRNLEETSIKNTKNAKFGGIKNKKYDANNINDDGQQMPFFRLDNKKIDVDVNKDANYKALKKLKSLLSVLPQDSLNDDIDDKRKELLFDVLVNQLKTLCCKKSVPARQQSDSKIHSILDRLSSSKSILNKEPNEYMFLIINDEIKSNGSDELIFVDPETLQQNSSVLLLGPISTPLTDGQLKIIMKRISNELSKPEYLSLLQQLSEGNLSDDNLRLMKNFIHGSESRRYIKPHRCNHQSKLARIYGGPKWLICTGYINLNTPSLYD